MSGQFAIYLPDNRYQGNVRQWSGRCPTATRLTDLAGAAQGPAGAVKERVRVRLRGNRRTHYGRAGDAEQAGHFGLGPAIRYPFDQFGASHGGKRAAPPHRAILWFLYGLQCSGAERIPALCLVSSACDVFALARPEHIGGLTESDAAAGSRRRFQVYVLQTNRGHYVGHTGNLKARLRAHQQGEVPSTAGSAPKLAWQSSRLADRDAAARFEAALKSWRDQESNRFRKTTGLRPMPLRNESQWEQAGDPSHRTGGSGSASGDSGSASGDIGWCWFIAG